MFISKIKTMLLWVTWQFKFLWKISRSYISKYSLKLKKKTCQPEEIIKDYKIKNSKKNPKNKIVRRDFV